MVKLEFSINLGGRPRLSQISTNTARNSTLVVAEAKKRKSRKYGTLATFVAVAVVFVIAGFIVWRWEFGTHTITNPFTPGLTRSVQFPPYYPTYLPAGYRIDPASVAIPQAGVVVFNLVGPEKKKIYISEEVRPSTYNLGGFYNQFSQLKETPVSDGVVAVGRINGGKTEIASRANNKVWMLSNTTADIPLEQLADMLKSMITGY